MFLHPSKGFPVKSKFICVKDGLQLTDLPPTNEIVFFNIFRMHLVLIIA